MNIVFTISEVSGSSGKTSVVNQVCELLDGLDLAIPYTTRTPRIADDRDRDFVFTSREAFELMIARGEFLEHVSVWGNYYGTPCHSLQQAKENGRDLFVKVDQSGVAQIKQKIPEAVSILVTPAQLGQDKDTVGSTIAILAPAVCVFDDFEVSRRHFGITQSEKRQPDSPTGRSDH